MPRGFGAVGVLYKWNMALRQDDIFHVGQNAFIEKRQFYMIEGDTNFPQRQDHYNSRV